MTSQNKKALEAFDNGFDGMEETEHGSGPDLAKGMKTVYRFWPEDEQEIRAALNAEASADDLSQPSALKIVAAKNTYSNPVAEPDAVDLETLEKECIQHIQKVCEAFKSIYPCRLSIRLSLEMLSQRGLLKVKPEVIEGLEEAIKNLGNVPYAHLRSHDYDALVKAARRYHEMCREKS